MSFSCKVSSLPILSLSFILQVMEETEESNTHKKCTSKTSLRGRTNPHNHQYHNHHHNQLLHQSNRNGFGFYNQNQYQAYPALLPLPPTIPLQLAITPPHPQNQNYISKSYLQKPSRKQSNPPLAASSNSQAQDISVSTGN